MENVMEKVVERYPLFINFQAPVACRGDFAGVTMKARVLVEKYEDGEFWMYGVNPGAICAEGDSLEAAHKAFSNRLLGVLFAAAEESPDFMSFATEVRQLFTVENGPYLERWKNALDEVRAGRAPESVLPREPGDTEPEIKIVRIVEPKPADNLREELSLARAA